MKRQYFLVIDTETIASDITKDLDDNQKNLLVIPTEDAWLSASEVPLEDKASNFFDIFLPDTSPKAVLPVNAFDAPPPAVTRAAASLPVDL